MAAFDECACPYCASEGCSAEWCDIGVGYIQSGPYYCQACGAVEIGPNDTAEPTAAERQVGWYAPGRVPDTVSSINNVVIGAKKALELYKAGKVSHVPFKLKMTDEEFLVLMGFEVIDIPTLTEVVA